MPRLILFRHAKATPSGKDGPADHDRRLDRQGRAEAEETGRALAQRGERPDSVLCSTSARTRETWTIAAASLPGAAEPEFLRSIYEAGRDYLGILAEHGGEAEALVIVGHNPAIQETAARLAKGDTRPEAGLIGRAFPTAAAAIFDFDRPWKDIAAAPATLVAVLDPAHRPG